MDNNYRDWGNLNQNVNAGQGNFQGGDFSQGNTGTGFSEGASGVFSQVTEALQQKVVAQSFLFMMIALAITAVGAKVASDVLLEWMIQNPAGLIVLVVAELAVVFISNWALKNNNVVLSASLLTVYSFINGATLGIVCMTYVESSVVKVFVITAVTFAITAVFGLVTKKDLSSFGSLFLMGLIGLIVMGLVNFFLKSTAMEYLISVVGVAIFVGLTAYDVQKIKQRVAVSNEDNVTALSLYGAFQIYLDFINLFLYLLRLFGKRK